MTTTVTIRSRYEITEAARTALALAGTPVARYQVIEIEMDAAAATIERRLAKVTDDGSIRQRTGGGIYAGGPIEEAWPLWSGASGGSIQLWQSDHVLTVDEAQARVAQAWQETSAKIAQEKAAQDAIRLANVERIARVVVLMSAVPASEWALPTTYEKLPKLREVVPNPGPDHVSAMADELPADLRVVAVAELARRQSEAQARRDAEAQAKIDERDAWIAAHGSARLQKGLALGQLMANVYRDERIAHDIGTEWIALRDAPELDDNDLLNPSEAHLDALADALKKWPTCGAELKSVGGTDEHGDDHPWRPALMITCPWADGPTAIRYLDAIRSHRGGRRIASGA